jgi:hypothetical protein
MAGQVGFPRRRLFLISCEFDKDGLSPVKSGMDGLIELAADIKEVKS